MTKIQIGLGIAVVAALTSGLVWELRINSQLRAELSEMRSQATSNTRAQVDASRLTAALGPRPGPPAPTAAGATAASSAVGRLRPAAGTAVRPSTVPLAPGLVPVESLGNAGRATPRATFSTQLWAARVGDVGLEATALAFGPEARARLEEVLATLPPDVRAEYDTPEKLMAFVLAGSPHPVGGMQVVGETTQGADDATLQTEWQHADDDIVQHSDVQLHRDADGWKWVVPLRLVNRAAAYLTRSPPVVTPAADAKP